MGHFFAHVYASMLAAQERAAMARLAPGVRQFGALILKKVHVFNSLSVS